MPKKPDIRQFAAVCAKYGMTSDQKQRFSQLLHKLKGQGHGGTANDRGDFTWQELDELASDFMAGE